MSENVHKQCVVGLIGTLALCFVGLLAIEHNFDLLSNTLAHGLTIAVMVSAFGSVSGWYYNPAVTFGKFVAL